MTTTISKLPTTIIQAINEEKLATDHVIYYDTQHGWIYQQRDEPFNNCISTLNGKNIPINLTNNIHSLEKLGPFGIKPTKIALRIIDDTDMYQTTVDQNLNRLNIVDGYGQHAPIVPITLTGRARDVACIPQEATHFCWIYPPIGLTQLTKQKTAKMEREIANGNLEYTFLALDGFAYFRLQDNSYYILQANCLVQAENGLTFQGPFQWDSNYTAHLAKQGRFQSTTISTLLELGIKYYCFINPNERLTSSEDDCPDWIPAPNGGFIYLYGSTQEQHKYDCYFSVADKPLREQVSIRVMPFSLIDKRKKQSQRSSDKKKTLDSSASFTAELNNKFLCSICFERTIRCVFIPCKHMCTCSECAQQIRQQNHSVCPICREIFREVWDVFL